MIYDILFAICGIGLIALGLSLFKLDTRVESWVLVMLSHSKRIQELEDRLEAHAAELTEHHNKIDTLEINGSVYEGLFEQQGLWGEETAEHSDGSEALEFPDPEDEEIII